MKKNLLVFSVSSILAMASCGSPKEPEPSVSSQSKSEESTKSSSTTKDTSSSEKTYTLRLDFAGGETFAYESVIRPSDSSRTIPSPTREGHEFLGWQLDGSGSYIKNLVIPAGTSTDRTYVAAWRELTFTVNFDYASSAYQNTTLTLSYNQEVTLEELTWDGHRFLGYQVNGVATEAGTVLQIKTNTRIVALWETSSEIIYQLNGGTNDPGNHLNFDDGAFTLLDPTREGYDFLGWSTELDSYPIIGRVADPSGSARTFIANWEPRTYEINAVDEASSFAHCDQIPYEGRYSIPTPSRDGYDFLGWYEEDGTKWESQGVYSVTHNVNLVASWQLHEYKINLDLAGGVAGETYPTIFHYDTPNIFFAAPTREGHTFKGWSVNGQTKGVDDVIVPKGTYEDVTVTALWEEVEEAQTYTISFDTDGGEEIAPITVTEGLPVGELPTPSKTGYEFVGWTLNYSDFDPTAPYEYGRDITLKASYDVIYYTITWDLNGGTMSRENWDHYNYGMTQINGLDYPAKEGHTFLYWQDKDDESKKVYIGNPIDVTGMHRDITMVAVYEENTYEISFYTDYGSGPSPITGLKKGDPITLPTLEYEGYDFLGWTLDDGTPFEATTFEYNGSLFLRAAWKQHEYKINYIIDGAANNPENPTSYTQDDWEIQIKPAGEKEHYEFAGWKLEGDETGSIAKSYRFYGRNTKKDVTFIAVYIKATIYVESPYDQYATGQLNERIQYGEPYEFADPVKKGYRFLGWKKEDGSEFPSKGIMTEESNLMLYPAWAIIEYAINYDLDGGSIKEGTTLPKSYNVETRDLFIPALEKFGKVFTGWYVNGDYRWCLDGFNFGEGVFYMDELVEINLKPDFAVADYNLQLDANGGTLDQTDVWVTQGEVVELPSPTKDGVLFAGWYLDGVLVKNGEPYLLGKEGTLVARYEKGIAYDLGGGTNSPDNPLLYGQTSFALSDPSKEGYDFVGWTTQDGETPARGYIVDPSDRTKTYTAHWLGHEHTITFSARDATPIAPMTVRVGDDIVLPVPDSVGHSLAGWYYHDEYGGQRTLKSGVYNFDYDLNVFAVYSEISYNLNYELDGGTNPSSNFHLYYSSRDTKLYAPTRENYDFVGWTIEGQGGDPNPNLVLERGTTGDVTLRAWWTPHQYSMSLYYNDGTPRRDYVKIYNGESFDLPEPTRAGWTFLGWYNGNEKVVSGTYNYSYNLGLTAHWEVIEYDISYDLVFTDDSVDATGLSDKYSAENTSSIIRPTRAGWIFLGWSDSENPNEILSFYYTTGKTGALNLTAHWQTQIYYDYTDDTGKHLASFTVRYGEAFELPTVKAPTGKVVSGWRDSISGETIVNGTWTRGTVNMTSLRLEVLYEDGPSAPVSEVRYDFGGGSQDNILSYYPNSYQEGGTSHVIGAAYKRGYAFVEWEIYDADGNKIGTLASGSSLPNDITGAITLKAVFTPKTYNIVFEREDGTLYGTLNDVAFDSTFNLPSGETAGYIFRYWIKGGEGYTAGSAFTMTDDRNITFVGYYQEEPKTCTITYVMNGGVNSENNPETYESPRSSRYIYLDVPENRPGYIFKGWSKTNVSDPDDGIYVTSIDSEEKRDYVLYAIWQPRTYVGYIRNVEGSDYTGATIVNFAYEQSYSLPTELSKKGYAFLGWYTIEDGVKVAFPSNGIWKNILNSGMNIYAAWRGYSYPISYSLDDGAFEGEYPNQFSVDESLSLPKPKKNGYTFLGWSLTPDGEPDKNLIIQKEAYYDAITVYAHWRDDRILVGLVPGDAVLPSGSHPTFKVAYGDTISLPTPTRSDYTFLGWYDASGRRVNNGDVFTYYDSVTLTARWEPIQYTITHSLVNVPRIYTVETEKTTLAKPTDIPEGYHFNVWKVTFENGEVIYYDEIILNETIAKRNFSLDYLREKNSHDLTIVYKESIDGPELPISRKTSVFSYGDSLTIDNVAPATYSLFYYYVADSQTGKKDYYPGDSLKLNFDKSVEIIAVLNKVFTSINYSNLTDSMTLDGAKVTSFHPSQGIVDIPNVSMSGYDFKGWRVYDANGVLTNNTPTKNLQLDATKAGEITLTAVFDGVSYPAYYDLGYGDGYRSEYFYGDTIAFTEPTRFGYTFEGWTYNGRKITDVVKMEPGYLDYITEENMRRGGVTFVATWKPLQYGIVTSYEGGMPENPNDQTQGFQIDSTIRLVTPIKKGYEFLGYTSELTDIPFVSLEAAPTMQAMADLGITTLHLKAVYRAKQTVVTFALNEGETLLGEESYTFTYDAPYTLPTASRTGYTFSYWDETLPLSGEAWNYVGNTLVLSANWTANTYTLTVKGLTTEKIYEMTYGRGIYIDYSLDEEGYTFVKYTTLPDGQGVEFPYQQPTWLYDEDRTIYANYTRQISFVTNGGTAINPISIAHYGSVPEEVVAVRGNDTFDGWFTDPGLTKPYSPTEDLGPLTLYARYAEETPTSYFTYEQLPSGGIKLLTCSYDGEEIVLPSRINNYSVVSLGESIFAGLSNLKRISIPNTITEIGQYAFDGCTSLESVRLPSLFEHALGYYFSPASNDEEGLYLAGSGDASTKLPTSLTKVTLGVFNLTAYAFYGASALQRIDYERSGYDLAVPEYCFAGCTSLSAVCNSETTPETEGELRLYFTNLQIGAHAFENCTSITAFYSGSNTTRLKSVGDYAFKGCSALHAFEYDDRLYFGISTESIGTHAFEGCDNFTAISAQWVGQIANEAFYGLSKITSILTCVMPEKGLGQLFHYGTPIQNDPAWTQVGSGFAYLPTGLRSVSLDRVTSIPAKAFYGLVNLENVSLYEISEVGDSAFEGCINYSYRLSMPYATSIGIRAFYGCALLNPEVLKLSEEVSVGADAFYGCAQGSNETVSGSQVSQGYLQGEIASLTLLDLPSYEFVKLFPTTKTIAFETYEVVLDEVTYYVPKSLKRIVLQGITSIPESMFKGFTSIREVFVPSNLTEVGNSAFEGCTSLMGLDSISVAYDLTRVNLPSTVVRVGDQAFKGCSSIYELFGIDYATYIGDEAFADCSNIERYNGSYRYLSLTNENRTYLGNRAFANNAMTGIFVKSDATALGDDIFEGASNLTSFSANVYASYFGNEIPATLKRLTLDCDIPASAYANMLKGQTEVTINGNVGDNAFEGCTGIISLSGTATSIGEGAFRGCENLKRLNQLKVTAIGDYAFQGCSSLIDVPHNTELRSIGNYAFQGCSAIISVALGNNVQTVGDYAFDGCSGLVLFAETSAEVTYGKSILSNASALKYLTLQRAGDFICLFGNSSDTDSYYGIYRDGKYIQIPYSLERIDYASSTLTEGLFKDLISLITVRLSGEVTDVPAYAFYGCSSLENIMGLETFQRIGDYAFYGCRDLRAFYDYYSKVYNRTANQNFMQVESIGAHAFQGVRYMPDIFDFSYLKNIGDYAFEGSGLRRITINPSTQLGIGVLKDCLIHELALNAIPEGGLPYLFDGNEASEINNSATLQNGVTYYFPSIAVLRVNVSSIPEHCFENLKTVQEWDIKGVKNIGAYAFAGFSGAAVQHGGTILREEDFSEVTSIGDYAFADSDIYTNDLSNVSSLGRGIFQGQNIYALSIGNLPEDGLASLFGVAQEPSFEHYRVNVGGTDYFIPTNFQAIVFNGNKLPNSAFAGFQSLKYFGDNGQRGVVVIPSTITEVGANAFAGTSFDTLKVSKATTLANSAFAGAPFTTFEYNGQLTATVLDELFGAEGKAKLKSLTFNEVSSIPASCFRGFNLTNLTLNGEITYFGDYAFYGASIFNLTFGSGSPFKEGNHVTYVGDYALNNGYFSDIYLGSELTHLGNYAFGWGLAIHFNSATFASYTPTAILYRSSLVDIYVEGGLGNVNYAKLIYGDGETLPDEVREGYDHNYVHDYSIHVNGNASSIAANRFKGDEHLDGIYFENPILSIGDNAFDGCKGLCSFDGVDILEREINLDANLTSIGAYAFRGTQLRTINFNGGNPTLGEGAFLGSTIVNVNNCENLATISAHAFEKTQINHIDELTNLVTIGDYAFYDLNVFSRPSFDVGDKLAYIGREAFYLTNVEYIYIPASVTTIGVAAFWSAHQVDVEIEQSQQPSGWVDWAGDSNMVHVNWGVTR